MSDLQVMSQHYFQKEGKILRPLLNLLVGQLLYHRDPQTEGFFATVSCVMLNKKGTVRQTQDLGRGD